MTVSSSLIKNRLRRRRAQGMTEYIIIVGLIAIVLIAAVKNFSGALESLFEKATDEISTIEDDINAGGS